MARIRIQDENREITDTQEIREFLKPFGIWYEKWDVEGRIGPEATNEEILAAYAPEIERLNKAGGFVTADVINVSPATPESRRDAREVHQGAHAQRGRSAVHGARAAACSTFIPKNGPVFAIQVESGDLINVPCGTQHWFDLCNDDTIRCIRLFQDQSGWTPHYVENSVHERYSPVCLGPAYVNADAKFAVRLVKV